MWFLRFILLLIILALLNIPNSSLFALRYFLSDFPWSLSQLINFVTFSLPCPAEKANDRSALGDARPPARVNPQHTTEVCRMHVYQMLY